MIGVSLYLMGSEESLGRLAQGLQVLPANRLEQGAHTSDFSFYDREENALYFTTITGDFGYACDIDLFHVTQEQLRAALLALSAQGLVIATPDEESASPFNCVLYEGGKVRNVAILQDTLTEEVRIQRAPSTQV